MHVHVMLFSADRLKVGVVMPLVTMASVTAVNRWGRCAPSSAISLVSPSASSSVSPFSVRVRGEREVHLPPCNHTLFLTSALSMCKCIHVVKGTIRPCIAESFALFFVPKGVIEA